MYLLGVRWWWRGCLGMSDWDRILRKVLLVVRIYIKIHFSNNFVGNIAWLQIHVYIFKAPLHFLHPRSIIDRNVIACKSSSVQLFSSILWYSLWGSRVQISVKDNRGQKLRSRNPVSFSLFILYENRIVCSCAWMTWCDQSQQRFFRLEEKCFNTCFF